MANISKLLLRVYFLVYLQMAAHAGLELRQTDAFLPNQVILTTEFLISIAIFLPLGKKAFKMSYNCLLKVGSYLVKMFSRFVNKKFFSNLNCVKLQICNCL